MEQSTIDYNVSVLALQNNTKSIVSALINPYKVFSTDQGFPRDWRGLFALCNIDGQFMPNVQTNCDPFNCILEMWAKIEPEVSTVATLMKHLETLDRFDIIDDAKPSLDEDVRRFCAMPFKPNLSADKYILTRDDVHRIGKGLEPQNYDAFVLFSDDDIDFATELIDTMEKLYNLKLCVKERDFVGGVFEKDAVIRLITERCNRLIVIVSQSFVDSPAHNFFLNYTQALEIDQRQRKVVPCVYKQCNYLPPMLSCCFLLDYRKSGKLFNFWDKLRDSIKTPVTSDSNQRSIEKPKLLSQDGKSSTVEAVKLATEKTDNSSVKFGEVAANNSITTNSNDKLKSSKSIKLPWISKVLQRATNEHSSKTENKTKTKKKTKQAICVANS